MSISNSCKFTGNLTKDPVSRTVKGKDGDTTVTSLSIAVNTRRIKGKEIPPVYVDLEVWDKGAEFIARDFVKGDRIQVDAEYKVDVFPDKETGENVYRSKFRVNEFEPVGKLKKWAEADAAKAEAQAPAPTPKAAAKTKTKKPKPDPETEPADVEEDVDGELPF